MGVSCHTDGARNGRNVEEIYPEIEVSEIPELNTFEISTGIK